VPPSYKTPQEQEEKEALMGLFGDSNKDVELSKLSTKIEENTVSLTQRIAKLQQEKTNAEIELDRVQEKHARENREIEHKLGLHKLQTTEELKLAKREASLEVQEKNLKAEKDAFKAQMDFITSHMEGEIERVTKLQTEILARLPEITVSMDRSLKESFNGAVEEETGKKGK
jgi:chromosome segregation ATPase